MAPLSHRSHEGYEGPLRSGHRVLYKIILWPLVESWGYQLLAHVCLEVSSSQASPPERGAALAAEPGKLRQGGLVGGAACVDAWCKPTWLLSERTERKPSWKGCDTDQVGVCLGLREGVNEGF